MARFMWVLALMFLGIVLLPLAKDGGTYWYVIAGGFAVVVAAIAVYDLVQKQHAILRNYPVIGHMRFFMEAIRPEMQQYFIERNFDGRPFDRATRDMIYTRAKGEKAQKSFGTNRDQSAVGYDTVLHSASPAEVMSEIPSVRLGGPDCTQPCDIAVLNISSMSFGALSSKAVLAMNKGAALGGFAHETGEGGLTKYHLEYGAKVIWQIGTGYFGCRTEDGKFDPEQFAEKAAHEDVKAICLKLSQGAKPGMGGVLPGSKVNAEIAEARGVPKGESVISPSAHSAFSTPRELMEFIGELRRLANGKPVGYKMCVGTRTELVAMAKAMLETGITPDFITIDGAEGGTGAAPEEFEDRIGTMLTDGLVMTNNVLVGTNLRDKIKLGASGKIATGADVVQRLAIGADFCNSARAMMMAVGCIQAQRCATNKCPVGVATQDPKRARAIHVEEKGERVYNFQKGTVESAMHLVAAMGLKNFDSLNAGMIMRRVDVSHSVSYDRLFQFLEPGELLDGTKREAWAHDWDSADPDSFELVPQWEQPSIAYPSTSSSAQ